MKKNALVIHSLFIFPLLTSSLSLSMQQQKQLATVQKQQMKKTPLQRKQEQIQAPQQKRKNRKKQINTPKPIESQQIKPQPQSPIHIPNQSPKLSYRTVVRRSLMQAKTNKNQPSIITQETEIEQFVAHKEETPLIFDEEIADTKETVLEELRASFMAKSQVQKMNESYHIHSNSVDLISPEVTALTNSNDDDAEFTPEEFPFLAIMSSQELKSSSSSESTCQALLQSVTLPTEKKDLGFLGTIEYYAKYYTANPITAIITYLQEKTYDATDTNYFGWLTSALQKAIDNNDLDSITTISALCTKHYDTIRYSDKEAQKSLNLYEASIADAEKDTEDKYTQIAQKYNEKTVAFAQFLLNAKNNYEQEMHALSGEYEAIRNKNSEFIKLRKEQIVTLSKLNKSIRPQAIDLAQKPSNIRLTNECTEKIKVAEVSLNLLEKISNKMPLIKEPKLALMQNQIENK